MLFNIVKTYCFNPFEKCCWADLKLDTFDGAKPRFLNRGKKRRSVSTLSIPRASDRGVEWVDFQENGKIFGHQGRIENVDIAVKIFGISYFGFNKRPGEENYEIRGTSEILNQKEVKER